MDGALGSLNSLASASFDAAVQPDLPLTQSQEWILNDVWRRVDRYGPRPSEMDEQTANLYTGEAAHLASFDLSKIKVLTRQLRLLPVHDVLPPAAAVYMHKPSELIEKSIAEMEAEQELSDPVVPYWDPLLRNNRELRMEFMRRFNVLAS